jgi:hypothetical protein
VNCPGCGCAPGEFHQLAECPHEVCPFCGGKLMFCECCSKITNTDPEVDFTDEEWEEYLRLLDKKGRIPYTVLH